MLLDLWPVLRGAPYQGGSWRPAVLPMTGQVVVRYQFAVRTSGAFEYRDPDEWVIFDDPSLS